MGSRAELVFAFVGPAGTRLADLAQSLTKALHSFGYQSVDVRLSSLLKNAAKWREPPDGTEDTRVLHAQDVGNDFRDDLGSGAALALAAIAEIRRLRLARNGSTSLPLADTAFFLHQLKHPEEVRVLRSVYGSAFCLIGGTAKREQRLKDLAERLARSAQKPGRAEDFQLAAINIINRDEKQQHEFGQNTRDTYPLADFFADMGPPRGGDSVGRFVDLLFGHPFRSPTPDEFGMYQAAASALRSADFNRQVGAVVTREIERKEDNRLNNLEVIASGMNEVPRAGGGYYWDGDSPDARDQQLVIDEGEERATQIKIGVLTELIERMQVAQVITLEKAPDVLAREALPALKKTQFLDIAEFSRPVHAEMAAIIDAARRGVSVMGHKMYVTTFPCHNCAKHIVAAGLKQVIYIEPYAKSRASYLYREELQIDTDLAVARDQVRFEAFTGIAPRQYATLFSMAKRGAVAGKTMTAWESSRAQLEPVHLFEHAHAAYTLTEREVLKSLDTNKYKWDSAKLS